MRQTTKWFDSRNQAPTLQGHDAYDKQERNEQHQNELTQSHRPECADATCTRGIQELRSTSWRRTKVCNMLVSSRPHTSCSMHRAPMSLQVILCLPDDGPPTHMWTAPATKKAAMMLAVKALPAKFRKSRSFSLPKFNAVTSLP